MICILFFICCWYYCILILCPIGKCNYVYIIIYIITAVFAHSHLMPCATRELFEKNTHGEFDHYTHTVYVTITFDVYELYMYICYTVRRHSTLDWYYAYVFIHSLLALIKYCPILSYLPFWALTQTIIRAITCWLL